MNALHLDERDDDRRGLDPTGSCVHIPFAEPGGEEMERQRGLETSPTWRAGIRRRVRMRVGHDAGEQPERLRARCHWDERPCNLLRVAVGFVRNALPGHVHLEPSPAEYAPEERLHHANRLDAPIRDRLVASLQDATVEADPVTGLADGEIEILVEGAGDTGAADDRGGERAPERARPDHRGGGD